MPVTTRSSTYLNVLGTFSTVYEFTPRSLSPLRCPISSSRLWSKCSPCFPWQRTKLNRDALVSSSYVHNSDDLTFHRKVCTETVGRRGDRGRSAETGPPHRRRGSDDWNRDASSRSWPFEQHEARYEWYTIVNLLEVHDSLDCCRQQGVHGRTTTSFGYVHPVIDVIRKSEHGW